MDVSGKAAGKRDQFWSSVEFFDKFNDLREKLGRNCKQITHKITELLTQKIKIASNANPKKEKAKILKTDL